MAADFSKVFDEIGDFGPYQCVICVLLAACMVPAAFSNLNTVFIMGVTNYWCSVPTLKHLNISQTDIRDATIPVVSSEGQALHECNIYVRNYSTWDESDVKTYKGANLDNATTTYCPHGWVFDTDVYGDTATTDWGLVCDLRWWQAAAASAYGFGMFLALLVYGTVADTFGRKPVLCWSTVLFIASNFSSVFSPNHQFLIATRFLCGFFSSPYYGGTFVLVVELVGPKWRAHVNAWYGYCWSLGGLLLAGLALAVRNWRYLQLTLSCLMIVFLVYFWLPESPRWLYTKHRYAQANAILHRIAKSNNKTFHSEHLPTNYNRTGKGEKGYLWHMFSGKTMAVKSIAMCFNWFAASLCYYGLTFNSTSLGANEYASFALSMLVELPAMVLCHILTVHVGRRLPLLISMILGGAILLATLAFEPGSTGLLAFVSIGKIACTLSFNLLYVYMVEVYPTVIRSIASSTGNFFARLGSVMAPFIAQLSDFGTYLPLVIFGTCAIVAGLLTCILPETINTELADTLEVNFKDDAGDGKPFYMSTEDTKQDAEEDKIVTKL